MALLNLSSLTFTAEQVRALNELLFEKVIDVDKSMLQKMHTFYTGIEYKRKIGKIAGTFGLVGKAGQDCTITDDTKSLTTSQKEWDPARWGIYLSECFANLNDTAAVYARKNGNDIADLTGTDYMNIVEDVLGKDLMKFYIRTLWFGDIAAANYNDSPPGVFTNTVDVDYFNIITGFFKQLDVIVAATPARKTTIAANAQATTATQWSALTPQLAFEAYQAVFDGALPELISQPDGIVLSTRSIADKARRYLQSLGIESTYTNLINGIDTLKIDGRVVYVIPYWDEVLLNYQNNATKINNPHRIVFTTLSNLGVGTPSALNFGTFNIFYDQVGRTNKIRIEDAVDAKILYDNLVQYGV